ncbi:hypothetical protein X747_14865 [Mesorhizobium sp. LNJC384A00]|uniref:hypothetical protein n=1 Tax=unclassified Mesorhizobium TaxID=325217 RepID=UPI0003CE0EA3|nr:hypothetical protein [Mesorhizobium sp. LNJC384A00]ESY42055.1 hypothetical protein X747_14865 [Mesorhizobium sp. LNJC384A00]
MKLFRSLLFLSIGIATALILAPLTGLSMADDFFRHAPAVATVDAGTMLTNAVVADVMRIVSVALLMVVVALVLFALAVSAGRFTLLRHLSRHFDPQHFSGLHRSPPG